MKRLALSEHDIDAVADVAAFCSDDPGRKVLQCVWFSDGWVFASDSYRLDAREVDSDHVGAVNPFTLKPVELQPPDPWKLLRQCPIRCEVGTVDIAAGTFGAKPPLRKRQVLCLGCLAWSVDEIGVRACGCAVPLVDRRFMWDALAGADNPQVRWRFRAADPLKPIRYDEPGHLHVLMPIRASEAA